VSTASLRQLHSVFERVSDSMPTYYIIVTNLQSVWCNSLSPVTMILKFPPDLGSGAFSYKD